MKEKILTTHKIMLIIRNNFREITCQPFPGSVCSHVTPFPENPDKNKRVQVCSMDLWY